MQRAKSHTPVRAPSDNVSQRVGSTNNQNNNSNTVTTTSNNSNVDNRESQQQKGLEWALGLSIRVKTQNDDEYEGQIYAYDPKINCVVLQTPSASTTPGSSQKYDFRILKISFFKDVVHLPNRKSSIDTNSNFTPSTTITNSTTNSSSATNGQSTNNSIFSTFVPSVGYVPMDRIQAREIQAVKETQAALARIGVGVTQKAQDIFDALSKTLPCRWAKESIVVLDEVIIDPPYDIDSCKANSGSLAHGSLSQVKKVLEGERKRLESGRK